MLFYDDEDRNVHRVRVSSTTNMSACAWQESSLASCNSVICSRLAHADAPYWLHHQCKAYGLHCYPSNRFMAASGACNGDTSGGAPLQVSKLGVTSVLVSTREGVSVNTLKQGLQAYNKHAR